MTIKTCEINEMTIHSVNYWASCNVILTCHLLSSLPITNYYQRLNRWAKASTILKNENYLDQLSVILTVIGWASVSETGIFLNKIDELNEEELIQWSIPSPSRGHRSYVPSKTWAHYWWMCYAVLEKRLVLKICFGWHDISDWIH